MDGYEPLEAYGVVGNLETVALVSDGGSVDWCCVPHLESPSVFGRLLDADIGGHFSICPRGECSAEQSYLDRTNVLRTRFETTDGKATLTDFMPVSETAGAGVPERAILRRVACTDGAVTVEADLRPRFDYARAATTVEAVPDGVAATSTPGTVGGSDAASEPEQAFLSSAADWRVVEGGSAATASVALEKGERHWFVFCYGDAGPIPDGVAERALDGTKEYWRGWTHSCPGVDCICAGPWHDLVVRSELVLKLLFHRDTGAIAAAPTTSLPETIGGVRNWDYRYNWIRDAAFTLQALSNLGHAVEAEEYFEWFLDVCSTADPARIQPLYGLHGGTDLAERELPHLSGYENSAPVRIGNEAAAQRQLDVYGELVLGIYQMLRDRASIDRETWRAVGNVVSYVADVWTEPDAGIWEVRSEPQHFVFSKVMCWTALDRGIRLATAHDLDAPTDRWRAERAAIETEVLDRGVDDDRGCFVRAYGSDALDASTLLVPFTGFVPFDDDRVLATIDAVDDRLATDDGLVMRYDGVDGLPGEEGAFVLCSFWLVDALALSGRVEEATRRFERVLEYVGPTGLLAEEVDPETGRQLGNFPQAFSHVGLVNAGLYLGMAAGREEPGIEPVGTAAGQHAAVPDDD